MQKSYHKTKIIHFSPFVVGSATYIANTATSTTTTTTILAAKSLNEFVEAPELGRRRQTLGAPQISVESRSMAPIPEEGDEGYGALKDVDDQIEDQQRSRQ